MKVAECFWLNPANEHDRRVRQLTIIIGTVVASVITFGMILNVRETFQIGSWFLLVPFGLMLSLNILYFIIETEKIRGVIGLISSPIQATILMGLGLYKFFVIFWMKPVFILISVVFTLDEILIVIESMNPECFKTVAVPWTRDIIVVFLRGWDKINEWRGGPPVERETGKSITSLCSGN